MADPISTARRPPHAAPSTVQGPGCLLRLIWIGLGHILLVFIATKVFMSRSFSLLDLAYWATVAAILGARYLIHRFHGAAASGEPATPERLRRYAYGVTAST